LTQETIEFFEIFPWDKNFETGISEIDEQHKQLVDILNHLAAHLANRSHPATLNRYFDALAEYADYRFQIGREVVANSF
jgi:hemerythrin-like metal-binding protein